MREDRAPHSGRTINRILCNDLLDLLFMITAERDPINRQAAKQMSRGNGRVQTVKDAMQIVAAYLARPEVMAEIESVLKMNAAMEFKIVVGRHHSAESGMSVALSSAMKTKTPNKCALFFGELV